MRLSVIIPIYNTSAYLRPCLDSILSQLKDWDKNSFELICVNDGSTDKSLEIIEEYQDLFSNNIKIVNKSNGGLSAARNAGLDIASGDYISFIDSDDSVVQGMFDEMLALAEDKDCDIVICDLAKTDEAGNVSRILHQLPNYPEVFALKDYPFAFSDMGFFACNKIFSKHLFKDVRFTESVHFEDIDLIPQLILKSNKIGNVKKPFYLYFERQGSISKSHTKKGLDMLKAVRKTVELFPDSTIADNKKALQNFIILQGFYSFGAYLAFVKDKTLFKEMFREMQALLQQHSITKKEVLQYSRHQEIYLDSLPFGKKVFYRALLSLPPGLVYTLAKNFS